MPTTNRAATDQRNADIADIKRAVEHIEEVVITGNGEPALREQVRTLSRWVSNVNKLAFVVAASFIGLSITTGCSLFFGIVIILYQYGLFKP